MAIVKFPAKIIWKRAVVVTMGFFLFTSFARGYSEMDAGGSATLLAPEDDSTISLITDQDGYFVKVMPTTGEASYANRSDFVQHTVKPGETLSEIAYTYGLKTSTILWANNLGSGDYLKVSQTLTIPPTDGVSVTVKKGNTLDSIAKDYSVAKETITQWNHLTDDSALVADASLFIPGGKPKIEYTDSGTTRTYTASTTTRGDTYDPSRGGAVIDSVPASGKMFIFPTLGKITQGFSSYHYGIDIGNRSQPDVWAAAGGTVSKTNTGCGPRSTRCGGGYGNYVIIDHGNGYKTLYGHLEKLYVKDGQEVSQGEVLGKMGNTGNVRGATGIHLHWEVWQDGVKKNPAKYY